MFKLLRELSILDFR